MAARSKTIKSKSVVRKRTATQKPVSSPKSKTSRQSATSEASEMCAYALDMLTPRVEKMLSHAEGAASGEEPRAIHQMRVWSRRSRAALDIFTSCFPGKTYRDLADEVKAVTRALGEARDLDVMLDTLQKRADALLETQRTGVESFRQHLETTRQRKQKAVVDAIAHLHKSDLPRQLHLLGDQVGYHPTITLDGPKDAIPVADALSAGAQADTPTASLPSDAPRTTAAQRESQEADG